jgi:hypothetical protein
MRSYGEETMDASFVCDGIAYAGSELLALSFAGPATTVKAARALLAAPKVRPLFEWESPEEESTLQLTKGEAGYRFTAPVKLGFSTYHLVAITKRGDFLPNVSEEGLWRMLQLRTTTPMLRDWVPKVAAEMEKLAYLTRAQGYGIEAGLLTVTDAQLDDVVRALVLDGSLLIPERK